MPSNITDGTDEKQIKNYINQLVVPNSTGDVSNDADLVAEKCSWITEGSNQVCFVISTLAPVAQSVGMIKAGGLFPKSG